MKVKDHTKSVGKSDSMFGREPSTNRTERGSAGSNLLNHSFLPTTTTKHRRAHDSEGRKRNHHRDKHTSRPEAHLHTQHVRQRDLPEPEYEEVDDRRCPRVASAIERLTDHHAVCVKQEAIRHDPETIDPVMRNVRIVRVKPDNLRRKKDEDEPDNPEKDHVVEPGFPHRTLGALRILCSQRLPHHRRSSVGHSPGRQECEEDYANSKRVTCNRIAAEARNDAHQSDPARHSDEDLKGCST